MTEVAPPLLFAFDGKAAPEELAPALRGLLELPAEVRGELGPLLGPCLEPMPDDQLDNRIARICRRHELDPRVAGPGFKGVALLFRSAAAVACEPEQLSQDLRALDIAVGDALDALLLPLYQEAYPQLRMQIVRDSIAAHGRVLTNIEWRVDTLGASNRGRKLEVPVALMTFAYQEAGRNDRFTMQLLPDAVVQLRDICDHLLKTS
jgi:hypothetical protein